MAAEAARRGALLLTVGAADSPLAEVCARARGVHIDVAAAESSRAPRSGRWLTPVLLAANALGLLEAGEQVLSDVADRLDLQAEACRPRSESFVNPAKVLATELAESIPMVLGDGPLNGVAACRAASMFARTGRMPASYGELPDGALQIVALLRRPVHRRRRPRCGRREPRTTSSPTRSSTARPEPRLRLLMLRDAPTRSEESADQEASPTRSCRPPRTPASGSQRRREPGHPLVRLAGHVALTDFAATYLALGLGMDPAVSPHVAELRDRTSR